MLSLSLPLPDSSFSLKLKLCFMCSVCALGELEIKLIDLLNYKSKSIERLNSMELINLTSLDRTDCRGFRALQAVLARNFCFWSAVGYKKSLIIELDLMFWILNIGFAGLTVSVNARIIE